MSRILEYKSSGEEEIISRILIQIHRSVDEHFPDAMAASRQFSKTVFSENENTAIVRVPGGDSSSEQMERETTAEIVINRPDDDSASRSQPADSKAHATPPPPKPRPKRESKPATPPPPKPRQEPQVSDLRSRVATQLPEEQLETGIRDKTSNFEIMFWGAMLVAGLILLAYVLFAVVLV